MMRWEMNLVCSGWVADGRERKVGSVKTGRGAGRRVRRTRAGGRPGPEGGVGCFCLLGG